MSRPASKQTPASTPGTGFATTSWSLVLAAGRKDAGAQTALEALCCTYWYPLYTYVRRKGYAPEDASDVIQGFFTHLLEKDVLAASDRQRGRFRTFLLTVLQRFLIKQRDRAAAQKRGGGRRRLSIDVSSAEERYRLEPFHELTPERIYERRWALTLLENVLRRLEQDCTSKGQEQLFERLRPFLVANRTGPSYAALAAETGSSEGALKVAVHRLRRRYRELLQEEVAQTVETPEEIQEELNHLREALR